MSKFPHFRIILGIVFGRDGLWCTCLGLCCSGGMFRVRGCTGDVLLPLHKVPLEFYGDRGADIKKAQAELISSAQLLFTSPASKVKHKVSVLFQIILVELGLQDSSPIFGAELVGLKCFPPHQQCLHKQIIPCQGKLSRGENKTSTGETCAVKPPALLALQSSGKFSCGGCAAQVKAH